MCCCQAFGIAGDVIRGYCADSTQYEKLQTQCRQMLLDKKKDPYQSDIMDEVEPCFEVVSDDTLTSLADQYYEQEQAWLFRR